MARISKVTTAAFMERLATVLESAPVDTHLYYTIDDDGVYLEIGDEQVHLGFDTEIAVNNLRVRARQLSEVKKKKAAQW